MSDLLLNRFLDILNMGVTSGAVSTHEDHAPKEGLNHEGQEKGQGRQVLTGTAAVQGMDSRRLPPDYDGGKWA